MLNEIIIDLEKLANTSFYNSIGGSWYKVKDVEAAMRLILMDLECHRHSSCVDTFYEPVGDWLAPKGYDILDELEF